MSLEDNKMKIDPEQKGYHWFLNTNLCESYCFYDDVFSDDEIDLIKQLGEAEPMKTAQIGSGKDQKTNEDYRSTEIHWIPISEKSDWLFRRLTDLVNDANRKYFGYDLHTIQNLQYSVYNEGQFYDEHVDFQYQSPLGVRKLSMVIHLTDPDVDYEGGELQLILDKNPTNMKKKKGTVIFFPSFLLHRVTPVTKGKRITLVSWVLGPSWA